MTEGFVLRDVSDHSPVRVVMESGALRRLGALAAEIGFRHALLVTDPGICAVGYSDRAVESLDAAGVSATVFAGATENPTTANVSAGLDTARSVAGIDGIVGLGGGSAMDCAKGINLLLTQGGEIRDYWGVNKTTRPLLPSILVPTTAGTGSEGQSFALISDEHTHVKMACGDRRLPVDGGLRPRVAILDPELTRTQPPTVAAAVGIDAISHAVETVATNARNERSLAFTVAAWRHLSRSFVASLQRPDDAQSRTDMLLGAHLAGCAIEQSMLGAAHSCANPLTARFGVIHGQAVGIMLPHVVRFNAELTGARNGATGTENPYEALEISPEALVEQLIHWLSAAGLPTRLSEVGVEEAALPRLAAEAAQQWTAQFNPRPVDANAMLELYRAAL